MNPFSALMVFCEESTSGSPDKGPVTRSFDAFFQSAHEQAVERIMELPFIIDAMALTWRHCN